MTTERINLSMAAHSSPNTSVTLPETTLASRKPRHRYIDDGAGTPYTCPTCGVTHIRERRGQKFCSPECYQAHWKANVQAKATTAGAQAIAKASERGTLTRRIDGTIAPRTRQVPIKEHEPAKGVRAGEMSEASDNAETGDGSCLTHWRDEDGTSGPDWAARGNHWQTWLQPSRILSVSGAGCSIRVEKTQLVIHQGTTHSSERGGVQETIRLSRGLHHVSVIVLLGRHGALTLDALQWCQDQIIAVVVVSRSGELVSVVTPPTPAKISLRRAQYAADPLAMARDTLLRKIAAQEWARPQITEFARTARERVKQAGTVDELRLIEGRLATSYWTNSRMDVAWKGRGVPE
jgi:hypothetical protein